MKRMMVVQWPDGLMPYGAQWDAIRKKVHESKPDLLITNEMPFGTWQPVHEDYDASLASAWVSLHDAGTSALAELDVEAVISSRPVHFAGRLANEGFSLVDGIYTAHHHKHLFPQEPGWYESSWFANGLHGFHVHDIAGIKVGFQLCTELMFNEHSRSMGRAGADLIVAPRATGQRTDNWLFAAQMASLVGGCYVASSNRQGSGGIDGPNFGGFGFVVSPGGIFQANTSEDETMTVSILDVSSARASKSEYPCYVKDLGSIG
jgi:N-carbamoylputrescine amidase